jgi:hypothetical protein
MPDKSVRDELTELTEAVRELRDREIADTLRDLRAEVEKLRAERTAYQCACTHVHWYTQTYQIPGCAPYVQPQIWYGTMTSGTSTASAVGTGYQSAGSTTMLSTGN